jgi:Bacterial membrane protein YfhO
MRPGALRLRPEIAASGALALQVLVLLWPAVGGEVFFRRDVHLMWFAQANVYERAWAEGSRLLWNPAASFGQPLLADANNQVFYPLTLLHLVLPSWTYYTLDVFVHLWLAGAGAAWLARRLGLGWLAAWAVGALWMATGPSLSLVDTWNQLAGAAWMPWSIAAGLRMVSPGGARPVLAWAAVTALQLLAGAPEMALLSIAGLVGLALVRIRRSDVDGRWFLRAVGRAVAGALLALTLAACQWVPALQAARSSNRMELPREARTHWSIHPLHLVQMACPVPLHRLALTAGTRQALFGAPDPLLPSLYVGVVGAALVAAALGRRSCAVVCLAVIALLATLLAMGRYAGLYDLLAAVAPPLRAFRYPAKALLLASLAWCLLCGFGLTSLADDRSRRWLAVTSAVLGVGAAAVACTLAFGPASLLERGLATSGLADARHLALRVAAVPLLAAVASALAIVHGTTRAGAFAALALVDLALAHHDLNPTAPVALYARRPPALQAALDPQHGRLYAWDYLEPGASRLRLGRDVPYLLARAPVGWDLRAAYALGLRESLFPPTASTWGAEGSYDRDVPGLEPAPMARLKDVFRGAAPEQRLRLLRIGAVSRVAALHDASTDGLRLLGHYEGVFVDPVRVFEVPDPLPRTYVVGTARVLPDDGRAIDALLAPHFDEGREVVLASGSPASAPGFTGSSRVRERLTDRVRLDVELGAPGWVVLVDAWDAGWRALVDGRPAAVERANVAFRAVAVPAGRHDVELVYRPSGVAPAATASWAGLGVLAAGAWLTRARRRERPVPTEPK